MDPFDNQALQGGLGRRAVRSGAITAGAQAVLFSVQFVGTILLARLLSPNDFGLVAMVIAVVGFLDTFKDLGLSAATIQRAEITRSQVNALFWVNVAAGGLLTLATLALAPGLAWFYGRPELLGIAAAISVGFLISGVSAQQYALLRRSMQFGRIASIDILAAIVSTLAGLAAAWHGFAYWSIVVQRVTKPAVAALALWSTTAWHPGFYRWDPTVVPMLRFGGFLAINNIMNYAARNVDNIAIGWMWGAGPLGIYSRAYNLLLLPISQVSTPMLNVAMPAFSRLHDDPARFRQGYLYLLRVAGLVLVPPVAVLIACADDVVVLLLGDRWLDVAGIYRWLGLIALVQPMTVTCGIVFLSSGRSKDMARVTLVNAGLTIVSIMMALPYGPAAVAASYAVSGLLIRTPILIHATSRVSAVTARDMYAIVAPQLLLGCVIVAGGWYAASQIEASHHWLRIAAATAVGATLGLLWIVTSRQQRASLSNIFALVARGSRRSEVSC